MRLPEEIRSVARQELEVAIFFARLRKRRVTGPHDEKNDGKCEKIHDLALIWLLCDDLGCHVAERADT